MGDNNYFTLLPMSLSHSTKMNMLAVTSRWLFAILAVERHGRDSWFRAPYQKLHDVTGFSSSTIRRGIVELRDAGFLEIDGGGLEKNPNLYYIDPDWLEV